ncbi:RimK family alpha-L-glutamate ligase [uncultured Bradyrhizobium sp.]|uniref:ATP-grasp domain-containing protein n=1 Tax=uncultured Bradyrhizobium sp. TaxID=199684 RepID=UPI0035CBCF0B
MPCLQDVRSGKPACYPDQSIYAEYACAEFGLSFQDIDGGTGLVFNIVSRGKRVPFGAGRCAWYPQNNATAASLATDKYFTNAILGRAGVPTLGGRYFFLHDRHRAHRPPGHERGNASDYFRELGGSAFAKPLTGSRGDFARAVHGEARFLEYLDDVSRYYDSVLIQPVVSGTETRIFLLDGEAVYAVRKSPPALAGNGASTVRELLSKHNSELQSLGLSAAAPPADAAEFDRVLADGEQWEIPGRMNRSAGGTMVLESPRTESAVVAQAKRAAGALGLRVAAVDLFAGIEGDPEPVRVIEVNSNPSIRLLEDCGRGDLILKIWRHTFSAMGLL